MEQLQAENERLRSKLDTRVTYRRSAALLLAAAAAFLAATQVFPAEQDVLIALAGTGTFGAILLITLTAERLLPARVTEAVCDTTSRNRAAIAHSLGADGPIRYVPTDTGLVRLYVAAAAYDGVPPSDALTATVVDEAEYYGLALEPTGRDLVAELERTSGDLPDEVDAALPMLFEAVTDLFELADSVETVNYGESVVAGGNQATVEITGSAVGDVTGIDHPISSLIGVGLATVVDGPVEVHAATDDGTPLITFGWHDEPANASENSPTPEPTTE
jgi:hypothetical protein